MVMTKVWIGVASTSRGLVGDTAFAVLPNITPIHTFVITITLQLVWLIKLWFNPTYKSFLTALTLCAYTSFLFGWHVHEKAILLVLVPLSLLAAERHAYFRTFVIANIAGIFSLFPLIFTPAESVVKIVYSILWITFLYASLSRRVYEFPKSPAYVFLDWLEKLYLAGFPLLFAFVNLFPMLLERRRSVTRLPCSEPPEPPESGMEFLPLMLTSIYCAVGLFWCFLRLGFIYMHEGTEYQGQLSALG